MQTFSLFRLLTDKTCKAVKMIYLLISVQFIFSMHSEWQYSLVFLPQSVVADDVGHLILFECASLS